MATEKCSICLEPAHPERLHYFGETIGTYRGYNIRYDPLANPTRQYDFHFAHDDYDGPGDPRCGTGPSVEACKAMIEEMED